MEGDHEICAKVPKLYQSWDQARSELHIHHTKGLYIESYGEALDHSTYSYMYIHVRLKVACTCMWLTH